MAMGKVLTWLGERPSRWKHMERVPIRQQSPLLIAVFLLFSVVGFQYDVITGGTEPYITVLAMAVISGLDSVLWILVLARMPKFYLVALIALQFFMGPINAWVVRRIDAWFHPPDVSPTSGLHFAGTAILLVVVVSYSFLARYMAKTGKEAYRLKNELELAQSIQKTLVPPIEKAGRGFEIYGISYPSEKVGGDLVDVVELRNGDTVAYLADIAGHGLQAGILMGMLKTASRTALTDEGGTDGAILSMLMMQLNRVLPQVKEAHMYATFTALRLNADGQAFYGMAASPPLLHWRAKEGTVERIEEEQFPLGLLPVGDFPAARLAMAAGDIVVVATDGILEVTSRGKGKTGVEFGCDALEAVVGAYATRPLVEMAAAILEKVRAYGLQADDQTLLLVRRVAA